ncbi:abortive infection protein [Streptomyces sp. MST-110588]|uniref:abortive infection protein n=1 Tax=Streptomyces sp. MST-110588 TaxID=2833628 RepID=UPI001F5DAE70|nr:abortive infection protein [Streptomyces sp. MST-110588]UNO38856.1 abortive infection protein [Streptomyces sp. MST-110588]
MTSALPGRRTVVVGAAALSAALAAGRPATAAAGTEAATVLKKPSVPPRPGRLAQRGVNYDTDHEVWRPEYVRREMKAIKERLHCNAVILLGHDLGRLTGTARIAAEHGLYVWLEPRHFDANAEDTLTFVLSVARAAEELRAHHPGVGLSVGCELTIFMEGLLPGKDYQERAQALGRIPPEVYNKRLNAFLTRAVAAVRKEFTGCLTYSSGVWEGVGWRPFDVVGVDLYRDAGNKKTYAEQVRALHRYGKPVVITEFGCCAFTGAEDMGGDGFSVVDYSKTPPEVTGGRRRNEKEQADSIGRCLDAFEAEGVYGAFCYQFIYADNPYAPDARYDLDMANFAVVKTYPEGNRRAYGTTGYWEPKRAFHVLAERFR